MRTLEAVTQRADTFKNSAQKQLGGLTVSNSKLSIQDMINATKRTNDSFGIEGKFPLTINTNVYV